MASVNCFAESTCRTSLTLLLSCVLGSPQSDLVESGIEMKGLKVNVQIPPLQKVSEGTAQRKLPPTPFTLSLTCIIQAVGRNR